MTSSVALSVTLLLAAAVSFTAGKIESNGFGSVQDKGEFGILTTPILNMACMTLDSTAASLSAASRDLENYVAGQNKEKIVVAKAGPSFSLVDEKFSGMYCLIMRDAGTDFPTPLDGQMIILLTKAPPIDIYIKDYMEMPTPENVAKRAAELTALLKQASVTDADQSNRYMFNLFPGQYRFGLKKK